MKTRFQFIRENLLVIAFVLLVLGLPIIVALNSTSEKAPMLPAPDTEIRYIHIVLDNGQLAFQGKCKGLPVSDSHGITYWTNANGKVQATTSKWVALTAPAALPPILGTN